METYIGIFAIMISFIGVLVSIIGGLLASKIITFRNEINVANRKAKTIQDKNKDLETLEKELMKYELMRYLTYTNIEKILEKKSTIEEILEHNQRIYKDKLTKNIENIFKVKESFEKMLQYSNKEEELEEYNNAENGEYKKKVIQCLISKKEEPSALIINGIPSIEDKRNKDELAHAKLTFSPVEEKNKEYINLFESIQREKQMLDIMISSISICDLISLAKRLLTVLVIGIVTPIMLLLFCGHVISTPGFLLIMTITFIVSLLIICIYIGKELKNIKGIKTDLTEDS